MTSYITFELVECTDTIGTLPCTVVDTQDQFTTSRVKVVEGLD